MTPVVVHLGLPKTGSTSVQAFFEGNRPRLAGRVDFSLPEDPGPAKRLGQLAMRYATTGEADVLERFAEALRRIRAGATAPLVLSDENLMGAAFAGPDSAVLYPALEPLLGTVERVFDDCALEYVLVLRNQAEWKRSVHNQIVRTDAYVGDLDQFLSETEEANSWDPLVARISRIVGSDRLHVLQFEEVIAGCDRPGAEMLVLAGLGREEVEALEAVGAPKNASISDGALEFLRNVNAEFGATPLRRRVRQLILDNQKLFARSLDGHATDATTGASMGGNRLASTAELRTLRRKLRSEVGITAEPGFPQMGTDHYLPYLQQLHRRLKPEVYFEIGTESGASLSFAECVSIAVDPKFRLDADVSRNKPELHLYQGTSDDFFASGMLDRLGVKVDLAFLDGMHLFEFLLRDFLNTERSMNPGGMIVLHDCVPFSSAVAEREWDRSKTRSWTGDVWKLIPILREYRPDLRVEVLNLAPTGLVLVSRLDPESEVLNTHYDGIVERNVGIDLESFGLDAFRRVVDLRDPKDAAMPKRPRRKTSGVIAIKTCVPNEAVKESWGDYHFARSLARAFEKLCRTTRVDIMPDWGNAPADDAIDIVLQGHDHHPPRDGIPSIIWMIYPGKRFAQSALRDYDQVFVASEVFARKLRKRIPALQPSPLLQAFDPDVMHTVQRPKRSEIVFVGNNHFGAQDRPMATLARLGGHPLRLWGRGWDGAEWRPYLQADVISNDALGGIYANALAVLCDHTSVMARNGFLSNRVLDALACGTAVISDPVMGIPVDIYSLVFTVSNQEEFDTALENIRSETSADRTRRRDFARQMIETYSFEARARALLEAAEELSVL